MGETAYAHALTRGQTYGPNQYYYFCKTTGEKFWDPKEIKGSGAGTQERGQGPPAQTGGEGQLHNKMLEQEVSGPAFHPSCIS